MIPPPPLEPSSPQASELPESEGAPDSNRWSVPEVRRDFSFNVHVGQGVLTKQGIEAFLALVPPASGRAFHPYGGGRFTLTVKTTDAAEKLREAGCLVVGGRSYELLPLAFKLKAPTLLLLPVEVPDYAVAQVLSAYGKVIRMTCETHREHSSLETGTRRLHPSLLFLRHVPLLGHEEKFRRCGLGGHLSYDCRNLRCTKCGEYGHDGPQCRMPCNQCGEDHQSFRCPVNTYANKTGSHEGINTATADAREVDKQAVETAEDASAEKSTHTESTSESSTTLPSSTSWPERKDDTATGGATEYQMEALEGQHGLQAERASAPRTAGAAANATHVGRGPTEKAGLGQHPTTATKLIMSLNVKGLRSPAKQAWIGALMIQLQVDVMLLQDAHLTCMREVQGLKSRASITGLHNFGETRARGVAILFSPRFQGSTSSYQRDDEGRLFTADVGLKGKEMRIGMSFTNLYFYLQGRRELILAGDLNCDLDHTKDNAKGLRQLVASCGLVDAWTHLHDDVPCNTFTAQSRSVRLDRFYVPNALVYALKHCEIVPVGTTVSNNRAVLLLMTPSQGPGGQESLRRLNTRVLQDEDVVKDIRAFTTAELDLHWRDSFTSEISEILRNWGHRKAAERRKDVSVLQWVTRDLRRIGLDSPANVEAYTELQAEFQQLLMARVCDQASMFPVTTHGNTCRPTIFAYADDLTVCTTSVGGVCETLNIMREYGEASGPTLNVAESAVLPFLWPDEPSYIHGVPVGREANILEIPFSGNGP
ncbi:hypothetical protein HPB47_008174 [Ixodes persulcatus]|uniref:Uncharacterized protein n=1 Tax=Ixodes persulcatus TaxID=34615 RepID=A0AC60P5F4_IXOPE|nr:hypothetical protein HPB47_008174 [Ixodes persulcatus]